MKSKWIKTGIDILMFLVILVSVYAFLWIMSGCSSPEVNKNNTYSYYRLKQVDNNGVITYYNIVEPRKCSNCKTNYYMEMTSLTIDHPNDVTDITDTLVITGTLTLKQFKRFNIDKDAVLIVVGAIEVYGNGQIHNKGKIYNVGHFDDLGGNSKMTNSGEFYTCQVPQISISGKSPIYEVSMITNRWDLSCRGLPITLKSFTVTRNESNTDVIEVVTNMEVNSDYIEVEGSNDVKNWKSVVRFDTNSPEGDTYKYLNK